jgi:anhydro-N-acetylmuramic acid kinase
MLPNLISQKSLNIIGINSGTSADSLDLAFIQFRPESKCEVLHFKSYQYDAQLQKRIIRAAEPEFKDGIEWLRLDTELGILSGTYAANFIKELQGRGLKANLIASHGQTIRHLPVEFKIPLTYQIGEPSYIAGISGLPVVSDFRRTDIASGGEGAPLSPILHEYLFRDSQKWRCIVNIGGISNATVLPPIDSSKKLIAGDCGPGNMLIDQAMNRLFAVPFDKDGEIASSGAVHLEVVEKIMRHSYFSKKPPKSTGRELFGSRFLEDLMKELSGFTREDRIATISEITIMAITKFIIDFGPRVEEVYICGGGAKNNHLLGGLKARLKGIDIENTTKIGYDPIHLEPMLWAYLAYCFINEIKVNTKNFTGATKPYIPGKLCLP